MTPTGAPFSDVWWNLRQLRHSPASWTLAILILGIQALVTAVGGPHQAPAGAWFVALGLNCDGILAGKLWQLLSYALLHGSLSHAVVNALFVLLLGSRIERIAGSRTMVKSMIFGIIGGAIGHLGLSAGGAGAPLLVGLSGGCVGLLLLLTTLSPESRMMPLPVSGKNLGIGVLIAELFLALIDPALGLPFASELGKFLVAHGLGYCFQMGHACHFGGGIAGWLYGRWLLRLPTTPDKLRAKEGRRAVDPG
jgi:membrane associated rhomboid family serine protease